MQVLEIACEPVTTGAAQPLGVKGFELREGKKGNLVLLTVEGVWEAIRAHEVALREINVGHAVTLSYCPSNRATRPSPNPISLQVAHSA